MSLKDAYARADETRTADGGSIRHFPRFGLAVLPDDDRRPREVTVYPRASPDTTTEWITADVEHAVPLEDLR